MYPQVIDSGRMAEFKDDFFELDAARWASDDDGFTTSASAGTATGSELVLVTANVDNSHVFASAATGTFTPAASRPIWFEARLIPAEANTHACNWIVGLSSLVGPTLLGDDGAGPAASLSGAFLYKVDGDLVIRFGTSNGTRQTLAAIGPALVPGHVYRLGFHWDPGDGVTSYVTAWVHDVTAGGLSQGRPAPVLLSGLAAMAPVLGVKGGSTSIETLKIDLIRCAQMR